MKNLIYLFLIAVLFSSCKTESSDDIEVSDVYQAYLYFYNKTDNKTVACAQFRDGGSFGNDIILNSPSAVSVNGDVLVHQNIGYRLYYHYYTDYQGEEKVGTFIFTDKYSKSYTNIANLNDLPAIDFPAGLDSISKAADFVFTWIGDAEDPNKPIALELSSADTTFTYYPSPAGATSVTIPQTDLANFQPGNINLFLMRSSSNNLQASTGKGGEIKMEYQVSQLCYIKD